MLEIQNLVFQLKCIDILLYVVTFGLFLYFFLTNKGFNMKTDSLFTELNPMLYITVGANNSHPLNTTSL